MRSYWVFCSSAYFSHQNLERCSLPLSEGMQHFCHQHLTPESHSICVHLTRLYCSHWQNGDLLTFLPFVFYVFGEFLVTWGIWLSYSFHYIYCPAYTMCFLLSHLDLKRCAAPKVCLMPCLTDQLSQCNSSDLSWPISKQWYQLPVMWTA